MADMNELRFSREHEWIHAEGSKVYVGITDYAQHSLGSIVFVELPQTGTKLVAGDVLGVVESVKAASDVYSPVSGTVTDVNQELADAPEKINEQPYESWIAVVELADKSELDGLMDFDAYKKFCEEEA
jgi:glycine cleavage system H protein